MKRETTKIAVFKYATSDYIMMNEINTDLIESEINEFCDGLNIIDIKVNTLQLTHLTQVIYTIIYLE